MAGEQVREPGGILLIEGPIKAQLVPNGGPVRVAQAADPAFAVQDDQGATRENPQDEENEQGNPQQGGEGIQQAPQDIVVHRYLSSQQVSKRLSSNRVTRSLRSQPFSRFVKPSMITASPKTRAGTQSSSSVIPCWIRAWSFWGSVSLLSWSTRVSNCGLEAPLLQFPLLPVPYHFPQYSAGVFMVAGLPLIPIS